jgi:alpha-ketoglutarate-dependent dioxygenase FTO
MKEEQDKKNTTMEDNRPPPSFLLTPSGMKAAGKAIKKDDGTSSENTNVLSLTPAHPSFDACLKRSFDGFVHESASALQPKFHKKFRQALCDLHLTKNGTKNSHSSVFQYDYTQPMGYHTTLARTRVRRCLVGQPGITYRYLGLRMFAHPWEGDVAYKASKNIHKLSQKLQKRAEAVASQSKNGYGKSNSSSGSWDDASLFKFNLTLINRMDPSEDVAAAKAAKPERVFDLGACSVSWHADSSLQDFSAISVYVAEHDAGLTTTNNISDTLKEWASSEPSPPRPEPWRVALRLVRDVEGPSMRAALENKQLEKKQDDQTTPALVVPMHDGDAYHMVGKFNHHHQHAVLQGTGCVRYSSTHRVGLEEGQTIQSICERAQKALESSNIAADTDAPSSQWLEEQTCLNDLEFEWLRQWYGQGEDHAGRLGYWWNDHIATAESLWLQLEQLTLKRVQHLRSMASSKSNNTASSVTTGQLVEQTVVLQGGLAKRHRLRQAWAARELDPLYVRDKCLPIPCLYRGGKKSPIKKNKDTLLPEDLSEILLEVESLLQQFSQTKKKQKACFHFKKFGDCSKGDQCPFSHEISIVPNNKDNADGGTSAAAPGSKGTSEVVVNKSDANDPSNSSNTKDNVPLARNDADALKEWTFEDTDFGDHFETPKVAYEDVKPLLKNYAKKTMDISCDKLRIYDPYYCRGHVVTMLNELGFDNVIHAKRDFYADIDKEKVPLHDVLLTNPPYSSNHKEKMLKYLLERERWAVQENVDAPFLLLLPAWSASKLAWRQFLWCLAQIRSRKNVDVSWEDVAQGERAERVGAFSERLEQQAGCFFVCPPDRYRFVAAVEARDEAPFDGIWFCGGWRDPAKVQKAFVKDTVKKASKGKRVTTVCASLAELRTTKLLPTANVVTATLTQDESARRKRALEALDEARRSDPGYMERKRRKTATRRDQTKMVTFDGTLDEKTKQKVMDTPKACRHYFGLSNLGGCTRGDSCRFIHTLP